MIYSRPTELLIEILQIKNYSEQTIKSYAWHLEVFLQFKKDRHYTYLSSQDLKDYLAKLAVTDKSEFTAGEGVFMSLLCWAKEDKGHA